MRTKILFWVFGALAVAMLTSCKGVDGGGGVLSTSAPMVANFDPSVSVVPLPNNILFSGSVDGTLNVTVANPADFTDPQVAMNELDGFSTVAPITTTFSQPLDAATIPAGVRMFEVSTAGAAAGYAVTGIVAELVFGVDFVAGPSPSSSSTLVILPKSAAGAVKPLKANTNYMVVITDALKSTSGQKALPSAVFTFLKQTAALVDLAGKSVIPGLPDASALALEPLRQLTGASLLAASTAVPAVNPAAVAITWSFKTQTIGAVLTAIQAASLADPYATNPANFVAVPAVPSLATSGAGVLDFYAFAQFAATSTGSRALLDGYSAGLFANLGSVVMGAVNLPYYLDEYSAANPNPLAPLSGRMQFNPASSMPNIKSVQQVKYLMTVPNAAHPTGAWPVVIFQHGFTVDKTAMFGIANTLAKAGFATIAIDSVLHGDRTFNLDLVNNTTGAAGSDGVADTSGTHYLNLKYLLTTRDNARQSVADLIHLTRLLEVQTMDVVNNTTGLLAGNGDGADLNIATGIYYVGHSNGGILGTLLASVEPNIKTLVLANPGGVYTDIFQNSIEISPLVNGGLAAAGVSVGSAQYNSFMFAAQTVADDVDPINYATASAKNLLMLKTTPDAVVPNSATNALIGVLGLTQVGIVAANSPFAGSGYVNYISGTHSTFLTPAGTTGPIQFLAATTEMQTATASFLSSSQLSGQLAPSVVVTTIDPAIVQ
ncbi:MAG: hypothetical protein AUJ56_00440 [Zetaproteobacteria bacterium CG1_02_49_23]|nr:MAG: hypothetical protein AUJ56_00440 [Zetaproteobacteria bacterium CG1_02_49_23]